jgi:hypothetical protein
MGQSVKLPQLSIASKLYAIFALLATATLGQAVVAASPFSPAR